VVKQYFSHFSILIIRIIEVIMATISGAVEGVFWDVDGTLVFTGSCCYDATVKTLVSNGLPGVTEEVRRTPHIEMM
jgi:hypothetical protein